jgi:hypothetical protein
MVGPFVGTYEEYSRVERKWVVSSTLRYKQAIYRGEIVEGYFVLEDGRILSDKQSRGRELRELSWTLRGNGDAMYPAVGFVLRPSAPPVRVSVHRIVAETYVPKLNNPPGVSLQVWNDAHESIKIAWSKIATEMCVNHIDHDKENFHPSNLEWVTVRENVEKRDQFYSTKKAA